MTVLTEEPVKAKNFSLIQSLEALQALADKLLAEGKPIGFDVETGYTGPDRPKGSVDIDWNEQFVCGFSITNSTQWARYIPIGHDIGPNISEIDAWNIIKPVLETLPVIAHNMKFELRNLRALERKGRGPNIAINVFADSMLQSYVLSDYPGHALKDLTDNVFGYKQAHIESLFPGATAKQLKALRFNTLELTPEVVAYACDDAVWTLALYEYFKSKVESTRKFMYELEMKEMFVLADMEDAGHAVDWEGIDAARQVGVPFLAQMEAACRDGLGKMAEADYSALNLNSTPQVRKALYEDLGMPVTRLTKGGKKSGPAPSTDAIALEALSRQYAPVKKILESREVKNLANRMKKWSTEYTFGHDKRVHASFNQVVVGSGRFSANDPAIQQLPKKWRWSTFMKVNVNDDEHWAAVLERAVAGKHYWEGNFRDFLVAGEGCYLLGYDYSQIELRCLAGMSQESSLLKAFDEGQDVHTLTAAMMLSKPVEEITEKDRAIGKALDVDALVNTPTGWRRMGDLEVGDAVIGSQGTAIKVTGVYPQGVKPAFEVFSEDGGSVVCCDEHLWTVKNVNTKNALWQTKTLRQLMDSGLTRKTGKYEQPKYRLPERPVVQYESRPEPVVSPYVMGLLLGDGGFTHSWGPSYSSDDPELLEAVAAEHTRLGGTVAGHFQREGGHPGFYLSGDNYKRGTNVIKDELRRYGLWEQKSHAKFVPDEYLYGSPETRLEMLRGLLDTDGNVLSSGGQFRVTSEALAKAVQQLARSLGGAASYKVTYPQVENRGYGATRLPIHRVQLRLPIGIPPFRLPRKVASLKPRKYVAPPTIHHVEEVGEREMVCISVDAADSLFQCEGHLITHNTMNFALLYGMGAKSLGERLAITPEEANALYATYFSAFTKVTAWMSDRKALGTTRGYIETYFGRKWTLWDLQSDNPKMWGKGERLCVNGPVQGTAADYMKISMLRAKEALVKRGWWMTKVRLINNLHDALTFEADNDIDPAELRALLEPAVVWKVEKFPKIVADWEIGQKWGSSKRWKQEEVQFIEGVWTIIKDVPDEPKDEDLTEEDFGEEPLVPAFDDEGKPLTFSNDDTWAVREENAIQTPKNISVDMKAMPTAEQFGAFLALVKGNPGTDVVTIHTPEGEVKLEKYPTSLTPDSQGKVSMALGGASMYYPKTVDVAAMSEGLSL